MDKWLIFVYCLTNMQRHSVNIRFNSSLNKIQFVDSFGAEIDFCERENKKMSWDDFSFTGITNCFLYTYNASGIHEYGIKSKKKKI